jgi:hypothetical protein
MLRKIVERARGPRGVRRSACVCAHLSHDDVV